LSDSFWK